MHINIIFIARNIIPDEICNIVDGLTERIMDSFPRNSRASLEHSKGEWNFNRQRV